MAEEGDAVQSVRIEVTIEPTVRARGLVQDAVDSNPREEKHVLFGRTFQKLHKHLAIGLHKKAKPFREIRSSRDGEAFHRIYCEPNRMRLSMGCPVYAS